jgi:uncharacterized protein DUF6916
MKLTRRNFIWASSAAASLTLFSGAGKIFGQVRRAPVLTQMPAESMADPLSFLSSKYFEPLIGSVMSGQSGKSRTVSFLLADVRDLALESNEARGYVGESFSLLLTAPVGSSPKGGIYMFRHPTIGVFSLLISPVGIFGRNFEAIVNRINTTPLIRRN